MTGGTTHVRAVLLALALLLVPGVVLAGASAAHADDAGVRLSRDHTTWSTSLDDAFFLPELAWTPGDTRRSAVWVRNDTGETTDVRVALTRAAGGSRWLGVAAGTGAPDTLSDLPGDDTLRLRIEDLAPGAEVPITLQARLDPDAPPGTAVEASALDVRVSAQPLEPASTLASSAHLELAPLFLGLALIGAAAMAHRSARRRAGPAV